MTRFAEIFAAAVVQLHCALGQHDEEAHEAVVGGDAGVFNFADLSRRVAPISLPFSPSVLLTPASQLMSWKLPIAGQTLAGGALISIVSVTFWRVGPCATTSINRSATPTPPDSTHFVVAWPSVRGSTYDESSS